MSRRILRLPEVTVRVGVSRSTIYSWMSQGLFPQRIALGPRISGWAEDQIEKWLEQRESCSQNLIRAPKP